MTPAWRGNTLDRPNFGKGCGRNRVWGLRYFSVQKLVVGSFVFENSNPTIVFQLNCCSNQLNMACNSFVKISRDG